MNHKRTMMTAAAATCFGPASTHAAASSRCRFDFVGQKAGQTAHRDDVQPGAPRSKTEVKKAEIDGSQGVGTTELQFTGINGAAIIDDTTGAGIRQRK